MVKKPLRVSRQTSGHEGGFLPKLVVFYWDSREIKGLILAVNGPFAAGEPS
jgi:hypothetical protein